MARVALVTALILTLCVSLSFSQALTPGSDTSTNHATSEEAAAATASDLACVLACAACLAAPETVIKCLACLACNLGFSGGDGGANAMANSSAWLAAAGEDVSNGSTPEDAFIANVDASAPGHSWTVEFANRGEGLIRITNTGSSLDTALVVPIIDEDGTQRLLDMAGDAVQPIPAGGSKLIKASISSGALSAVAIYSATGVGENGDGFALATTETSMPGSSAGGLAAMSLGLLTLGLLTMYRRRRALTA